jgi:hypothetical protein
MMHCNSFAKLRIRRLTNNSLDGFVIAEFFCFCLGFFGFLQQGL